jgi:hypothetical protein
VLADLVVGDHELTDGSLLVPLLLDGEVPPVVAEQDAGVGEQADDRG